MDNFQPTRDRDRNYSGEDTDPQINQQQRSHQSQIAEKQQQQQAPRKVLSWMRGGTPRQPNVNTNNQNSSTQPRPQGAQLPNPNPQPIAVTNRSENGLQQLATAGDGAQKSTGDGSSVWEEIKAPATTTATLKTPSSTTTLQTTTSTDISTIKSNAEQIGTTSTTPHSEQIDPQSHKNPPNDTISPNRALEENQSAKPAEFNPFVRQSITSTASKNDQKDQNNTSKPPNTQNQAPSTTQAPNPSARAKIITLRINDRFGTKLSIKTTVNNTIFQVKQIIGPKIGRRPEKIVLMKGGSLLKDSITVLDYGLSDTVSLELQ